MIKIQKLLVCGLKMCPTHLRWWTGAILKNRKRTRHHNSLTDFDDVMAW